jgi:5-methyltetrahydropteroyltriglutamate--homocysteine methyltransferase
VASILTTHTGSLPRPADLAAMIVERDEGGTPAGLESRVAAAVAEAVRRQAEIGIDFINDGEQSKVGYSTYIKDRLTGFEGEPGALSPLAELADFPDDAERMGLMLSGAQLRAPACTGPVQRSEDEAVGRDLENLRAAAGAAGADMSQLFMTAASPGVIALFFEDRFYGDREQYLGALAEAMRPEYEAIADAGVMLQLDCPDLAAGRHTIFAGLSLEEFRRDIALNVAALNHATRGIAPERMRLHLCWGNYEGPHTHDVPLADIIDVVLDAAPLGLSIEASNPRHGHESNVFAGRSLPEGKYLIPGVIDSTTNFVEHPDLVAQRIAQFASVVGPERVVAGTDCGFGTFVGLAQVTPTVAWTKLRALVEGAGLARV